MTKKEISSLFNSLRSLLLKSDCIIAKECSEILENDFILVMTFRTRKMFRNSFGHYFEEVLKINGIKDDEYFRTFEITHNNYKYSFVTNEKLTTILQEDVEFVNHVRTKITEVFDEIFEDELRVFFIKGQISENYYFEIPPYRNDPEKRKKIIGEWGNENSLYIFSENGKFHFLT